MTAMTDDFLRGIANDYRRHAPAGRPAVEIAAERGAKVATVRRWVMGARARGFLDPTTQGRMSGEPESTQKRALRAAALREAADLAEDVANELFTAYDTEQGNGAMAVAARLRAHSTEEPRP